MTAFPKEKLFDITLEVINGCQSEVIVSVDDIAYYEEACARLLGDAPSRAVEEILDLKHLYPFFYFLPFVFGHGLTSDRHAVRRAALVFSLCVRKVMIVDWSTDHQEAQIQHRGLKHFRSAHLGYYLQQLDDWFYGVCYELFPSGHPFWAHHRTFLHSYLGAMLNEQARNQEAMGASEGSALIQQQSLQKSALIQLCATMIVALSGRMEYLPVYRQMIEAFILLLTLIDDSSDYVEDARSGQASALVQFLTNGESSPHFDESLQKALMIKFYLGGGLEFVRDKQEAQFEILFELVRKHEHELPLLAWKTCLENLKSVCADGLATRERERKVIADMLQNSKEILCDC